MSVDHEHFFAEVAYLDKKGRERERFDEIEVEYREDLQDVAHVEDEVNGLIADGRVISARMGRSGPMNYLLDVRDRYDGVSAYAGLDKALGRGAVLAGIIGDDLLPPPSGPDASDSLRRVLDLANIDTHLKHLARFQIEGDEGMLNEDSLEGLVEGFGVTSESKDVLLFTPPIALGAQEGIAQVAFKTMSLGRWETWGGARNIPELEGRIDSYIHADMQLVDGFSAVEGMWNTPRPDKLYQARYRIVPETRLDSLYESKKVDFVDNV